MNLHGECFKAICSRLQAWKTRKAAAVLKFVLVKKENVPSISGIEVVRKESAGSANKPACLN